MKVSICVGILSRDLEGNGTIYFFGEQGI